MTADRIKVLYKPVGKPFEVREIPNTLEACQELVGGYIEPVTICTDLVLVCNEEGRIRGMKPNPYLGYDFVGDWFLCGRDGEEFTDIPPHWLVKHMALMRRRGMAEREKVIWGLEQFIDDFKPFCGNRADWQKVYDALALLREQEPRVMDAEEMARLTEEIYQWLWIEEIQTTTWNLYCLRAFVYSKHPDTGEFYILANGYRDIVKLEGDEYGKTWRCWTSRPTPEQMRAVPWN